MPKDLICCVLYIAKILRLHFVTLRMTVMTLRYAQNDSIYILSGRVIPRMDIAFESTRAMVSISTSLV